jgi:hypothetical protein
MFAQIGDWVEPGGWKSGMGLEKGLDYTDSCFPGCAFYLPSWQYTAIRYAVNIKITGKKPNRDGMFRCEIEFVGDGEPSTFCGGWIKAKGVSNE